MSIIIFIVILLVLVLVHEFGHFIVAKKSGIRVDEFAFGFPPKLFSVKKGETTYSFNAIPFGGYVKIHGENPDEESTTGIDSSRSMVNKPRYTQALVLVAGVTFNLLLAWLLLSIGLMAGMPTLASNVPQGAVLVDPALRVTGVLKDSPAQVAGIKSGDKIIALSDATNAKIEKPTEEQVRAFISAHTATSIEFTVENGKGTQTHTITPKKGILDTDAPAIGISMDVIGTVRESFGKAIWHGLKGTVSDTGNTAKGFGLLIAGAFKGTAHLDDVSGPVGIVGSVGDAARFGFGYLLSFAALISINLAIINLVPFPALDGGRLLFLLIEKIKGSRIKPQVANMVNGIGFALLIILMIVITYHDIVRLL